MPGFSHEGKAYFVPIDWSNTALVYRTDLVPEADIESLQVFADPRYQGKISIGDNVDDAYALAPLVIGFADLPMIPDAQFTSAPALLPQVPENLTLSSQN